MAAAPLDATDRTLELRRTLHGQLVAAIDVASAEQLANDRLEAECRARLDRLAATADGSLSTEARAAVVASVLDDVFRLGPLEPLLADPTVADVLVNAPDRVYVERHGAIEPTTARFRDRAHLLQVIQRIVRKAGRRVDERSPMVDARLPDGSRVNVVLPPLALDGPQLSIRRFPQQPLTLDGLVAAGALPARSTELLRACVQGRMNLVVSGGAGVGKTTMLNAISAAIGGGERVVTIEDAAELRLATQHLVRLETRAPNLEGVGAVTTRDLVRNALRMRPDRILIGECRGAEAFDMLQAMNTGHDGSMTTLHASSARQALARLESMLLMSGFDVPVGVLRDYIADAVQVVIHLTRLPDGRRVVGEIGEIRATAGALDVVPLHVFELRDGAAGAFRATGQSPGFAAALAARGVRLDPALFAPGPLAGAASR
jgi:pilus assembly protein CpaF